MEEAFVDTNESLQSNLTPPLERKAKSNPVTSNRSKLNKQSKFSRQFVNFDIPRRHKNFPKIPFASFEPELFAFLFLFLENEERKYFLSQKNTFRIETHLS
jgi:hypothetical protein